MERTVKQMTLILVESNASTSTPKLACGTGGAVLAAFSNARSTLTLAVVVGCAAAAVAGSWVTGA